MLRYLSDNICLFYDTQLLKNFEIMDYSILLAVHNLDQEQRNEVSYRWT